MVVRVPFAIAVRQLDTVAETDNVMLFFIRYHKIGSFLECFLIVAWFCNIKFNQIIITINTYRNWICCFWIDLLLFLFGSNTL